MTTALLPATTAPVRKPRRPVHLPRLIAGRARRMGFRPHEIDDAVQEVTLRLAALTAAAAPLPLLMVAVDRQLAGIVRSRMRYLRHLDRYSQRQVEQTATLDAELLACDVRAVVTTLPAMLQQLCGQLAAGRTVTQIAAQSGQSVYVLKRHVAELQDRFRAAGLENSLP